MPVFRSTLAALLLCASGGAAFAVTDEIQVYTGEIMPVGEFGLTWHNNYTAEGLKTRLDIAWQAARQADTIGNPNEMLASLIGASVSADTKQAISRAESKQQSLALLLMAPEFQRR